MREKDFQNRASYLIQKQSSWYDWLNSAEQRSSKILFSSLHNFFVWRCFKALHKKTKHERTLAIKKFVSEEVELLMSL
jgi:hypothetical protein